MSWQRLSELLHIVCFLSLLLCSNLFLSVCLSVYLSLSLALSLSLSLSLALSLPRVSLAFVCSFLSLEDLSNHFHLGNGHKIGRPRQVVFPANSPAGGNVDYYVESLWIDCFVGWRLRLYRLQSPPSGQVGEGGPSSSSQPKNDGSHRVKKIQGRSRSHSLICIICMLCACLEEETL